ncbi:hypothetical protein PoMZ_08656, partial [Pyricularia oryzae]
SAVTTAPKARRTAGLHGGVTCRPADTIVFAGGQKLERRHAPGKNQSEYLFALPETISFASSLAISSTVQSMS